MAAAAAAPPSPHAVGTYEPIDDVNAPYIQEIARYACIEYNRRQGHSSTPYVYQKVVSGERQVVSGTNYKLILNVTINKQIHNYEVIVYDKPWESYRNLTSFNPFVFLGGYQPIKNLSDPYISEIGRYACIEYNRKNPNPTPLVFKKVVSGEEQVVAGTNYKLILYTKRGSLNLNYEVIVYDKPWESHRELTSLKIYHN
ncbi:cysteine proteinase inhibitor 1-like [Momordica charantia]|uniref:Cysteine proteinase inhibitor 1-like n=1 Tax=Momordica charantia TaxID=3673 RepID=A0A6J1D1J8_MOMCH|nr:cysteine proteinase inhibitor 1-like [Momordica charantia]